MKIKFPCWDATPTKKTPEPFVSHLSLAFSGEAPLHRYEAATTFRKDRGRSIKTLLLLPTFLVVPTMGRQENNKA